MEQGQDLASLGKKTRDSDDCREILRLIKEMETELLSYTKIMRVKPYNLAAIERRLARSPDHPMTQVFTHLKEKIVLLSKIFKVKYNTSDLKPFFTMIKYRYLSPLKQTLIDDWIPFLFPNHDEDA